MRSLMALIDAVRHGVLLSLLIGNIGASTYRDNCHIRECDAREHILCRHQNKSGISFVDGRRTLVRFGEACPKDVRFVNIDFYKELILELHNALRNVVASGRETGTPKAAKMRVLTWDPMLSAMSAHLAATCQLDEDTCLASQHFPYARQNVLKSIYDRRDNERLNLEERFTEMFQEWLDEVRFFTYAPYNDITMSNVRHFLRIINDANTSVGCAAASSRFAYNEDVIYFVCTYGTDIFNSRLPFRSSERCGSECSTYKRQMKYECLCDEFD